VKPWHLIVGGLLLMVVPMLPAAIEIPVPSWSVVAPVAKVTAGVYVEDFRERPVPQDIKKALNALNTEHGIVATSCDVGEPVIPLSYAAPVEAAKKAGLPSFVFMAGSEVVKVLHKPTGDQVLGVMK
jgi:hypothetical protein